MPRRALVEASEVLAQHDPQLAAVIATIGPPDIHPSRPKRTHFADLARAICYQQLAGAAASAIHGRFEALFDGAPTPEAVLAASVESLRAVGLSGSKTVSIRDLAQHVVDGDVLLDRVGRLSDDEIVRELTLVRGIGRWTAEMFLMFNLLRPDVFPLDDLGLQKGIRVAYFKGRKVSVRTMKRLGETWRPWRSVATWYLWRSLDPVPVEY
jgi:DNA-3-methyladenine glycosylase II